MRDVRPKSASRTRGRSASQSSDLQVIQYTADDTISPITMPISMLPNKLAKGAVRRVKGEARGGAGRARLGSTHGKAMVAGR